MRMFLMLSLFALPLWAAEDRGQLSVSVTVVRGQDTAREETPYSVQSCVVESDRIVCVTEVMPNAKAEAEAEAGSATKICQLRDDNTTCWY